MVASYEGKNNNIGSQLNEFNTSWAEKTTQHLLVQDHTTRDVALALHQNTRTVAKHSPMQSSIENPWNRNTVTMVVGNSAFSFETRMYGGGV